MEHNLGGNYASTRSPPPVSTTYTTSHTYPGVGAVPQRSGFAQNVAPGAAAYNVGIPTGVNQLGGPHAAAPNRSATLGSFPPSPPPVRRQRRPSTARRSSVSTQPGAAQRRAIVPETRSLTPETSADESESGTESDEDDDDDDDESSQFPDSDDEELVRSVNTASRRRRMKTMKTAKRRRKSSSSRGAAPSSRDETDEDTASALEAELAARRDVLRRESEKLAALDEEAEKKNRSHCSHLMRAITYANTEIKGLRTDQHRVLAKERARSRKLERQLTKLQRCYRRVQAAKPRHSWTPSGYGTC